ncbi:MAG TPA: D-2-hydroxyacid dehydrogenase [Thermoanaerobaculia bacterium]|nr:D-2-hydroxyacid dehydrogenase [Thermoanaerobaculia bacterium]
MHLLAIAPPDFRALDLLRREAPGLELSIGTDADSLRDAAARADAVLLAPRYGSVLTELWRELGNVRWIHTLAAGVESLPFDLLRRSEVVVTNSRGLYADALGEFAIAAMLWFAKDLRRMMRNQEQRRWEPFTIERLEGQTLGIIGYGGIGHAVGRRAEALGMHILPIRRRQELGDPTIEDVIAQSDYVVMSTPLTPSTHRLLSRERIALMKSSAVLINIGRGATVDEDALVDALRERRLRGAALDVFEVEPLPPEHPLWQLDNVLLSPHTADHTADAHLRAMHFFIENLRRFRAGDSLENVVDKNEQY